MSCEPEFFKPTGVHITVKVDEAPDKVGSILLPEGSLTDDKAWATVIRVGRGYTTFKGADVSLDVEPGDRVLIVRLHERVSTQQAVQAELGEGFLILKCEQLSDDVIAVQVPEGDPVVWRRNNLEQALAKAKVAA